MPRLRSKYLPIIVLLAISQPACDLDLTGIGEGIEHADDFQMGPFPMRPMNAISVVVQPFLADSGNWVFGTIRDGSYVDSLRVSYLARALVAGSTATPAYYGRPRPGTYDVTVAALGYVTWDTTGVVVQADNNGIVQPVRLEVQLVEVP